MTDFGFNGRHAYYFLAVEKGYYKEEGLDVTIVRGQGSSDAVKQVAAGAAQIGFADASAVILARGNDQTQVKLVSIIYAKPPHAIYVLKSSGIVKPKDLEGRKLADTAFSSIPKLFPAYAKAAGVDARKETPACFDERCVSRSPQLRSSGWYRTVHCGRATFEESRGGARA